MNKLSAIVIAKDSEDIIGKCLKSVEFADEIVVVDAGSKDKTTSISKSFGAKVIEVSSTDFSSLRDIGLQHAKGDWVLYVDTDEIISEDLKLEIKKQLSATGNEYMAFKIKRKNYYFGGYVWPYIENLERLFLKKKLKGWYGKLHESPNVDGKISNLNGFLIHFTHTSLFMMVDKTNQWSEVEAKLRFDRNHPKMSWWRFFRVMITAFFDSYIKQFGFKAKTAGIVESIYQSFSIFITYAKLWEMQSQLKNEK